MHWQLRVLIWALIVIEVLTVLAVMNVASAAPIIQDRGAYVLIPKEKFDEMTAYVKEQERFLKHHHAMAEIYKNIYYDTKKCAQENALLGVSVLSCFNRNSDEDVRVKDSEMQQNVTEM